MVRGCVCAAAARGLREQDTFYCSVSDERGFLVSR
jgi:hypothetical protein